MTGMPSSLAPLRASDFGLAQARTLLMRAGFGGTPAQVASLVEMGPDRAVDLLVECGEIAYEGPAMGEFDDSIMLVDETGQAEYRRAQRAGDEDTLARLRLRRQEQQRRDRDQIARVQRWWLARMIETPRPLEEKMTLFWHGRFAASYRKVENSAHMLRQNEFFRANALGSFRDLLVGIIRDPAMLAFLDNNRSRKERPNENLARELMELFSLGVGAYTERDIREGARALTGHTFEGNEFVFRDAWHDTGPKTILGVTGALTGDDFVRAILNCPECARFLALALYRFFVRDDVPDEQREQLEPVRGAIRNLAVVISRERFQLKPALKALFRSRHFYEAAPGGRIKSPAELIVGAVRTFNAPPRDLGALIDAMERMGQELFFPPSVAGWDGGRAWINTSTLYVRQNALVYLLAGVKPGVERAGREAPMTDDAFDSMPLLADGPGAPALGAEEPVKRLLTLALGEARPERVRDLLEFVGDRPVDRRIATGCLTLIAAMPEFQLA